ncbi:inositol hexakisphosphate and diphosphoinositol-pentakisphosphate kinase [Dimargaris xerosporica]|nr:inositol hexakisphosphate and diphosphoinositol-pentakisphosphate kinase [Dimargaris xerosporica]
MTKPSGHMAPSPHFFQFSKSQNTKFVVGVCALDKKARSKPMGNIIERLIKYKHFEVVVLGDKVILDEDISKWPWCDFMISFYSQGFPLRKAIAYQKLRGVFSVNSLPLQELLWDRRLVLGLLNRMGVPSPRRLVASRDGGPRLSADVQAILETRLGMHVPLDEPLAVVEQLDYNTIRVNGQTITKPFVEKPVSGEDHNIYIYFSQEQGGGVRKLFRKVGNKSSEYFPDLWEVRSTGSFLYEEFIDVDNAEDVKVYTIGPSYTHAETRKSPVVDGVVRRNAEGKEVRYVTELSPDEKRYARKVVTSFGQAVCGIDYLRVDGRSLVIDVNGWSFVKGSSEYYDTCAQYLRDLFLQAAEQRMFSLYTPRRPSHEDQWTLKGFLSVFRHADRTPKQKNKYGFTSAPFVALLKGSRQEVILRKVPQLAEVLEATDQAIAHELEDMDKLHQLRDILSRKMHMEGTKVQLKPSYNKQTGDLIKIQVILKWGGGCTHAGERQTRDLAESMRKDLKILNRRLLDELVVYSSSEQRVIATAKYFCETFLQVPTLPEDFLIIRKDMLDDSNAAKEQMDAVKSKLKAFFKAHEANLDVAEGFNLPDEMQDPQTFVRGVYDLLARVTRDMRRNLQSPLIQQTVLNNYHWCCNENVALFRERWEKLLQDFGKVEKNKFDPGKVGELYDSMKYDALHNRLLMDRLFIDPESDKYNFDHGHMSSSEPRALSPLLERMSLSAPHPIDPEVGANLPSGVESALGAGDAPLAASPASPHRTKPVPLPLATSIGSDTSLSASTLLRSVPSPHTPLLADGTDLAAAIDKSPSSSMVASALSSAPTSRRRSISGRHRLSPFPYNRTTIERAGAVTTTPELIHELYHKAKLLFDFVTPREYGINKQERLEIGVLTSVPLLKRILADLHQIKNQDNPGCRFYFTKESHVHTLLNCVFLSGLPTKFTVHQVEELDFLTQITFEVYERKRDAEGLEPEYSLRVGFSPGAYYSNVIDHQVDAENHSLSAAPRRDLTDHIELATGLQYLQTMLDNTAKSHP